jgi:hypothetical protein
MIYWYTKEKIEGRKAEREKRRHKNEIEKSIGNSCMGMGGKAAR